MRLPEKLNMSNKYNPIHAAASGIVAGFILFAVQVVRSESWWPSSALSELGLKILILLSVVFAIVAVMRNWLLERGLRRNDERRASEYRRVYRLGE
jgi:hypothetical protein